MNILLKKLVGILGKNEKDIVIYGAGVGGAIVYSNIKALYGEQKKVRCFVDKNSHKQEKIYYGLRVYRPEILLGMKNEVVVLVVTGIGSGVDLFLDNLGYKKNQDYFDLDYLETSKPCKLFDPCLGFSRKDDIEGFKKFGNKNATKRIVVLGNSSTDYSTSNLESWPFKLSKKMPDFEVYNGAIGAYTSLQEIYKLVRDVMDLEPTVIISMSGITDAVFDCLGSYSLKEIPYLSHRVSKWIESEKKAESQGLIEVAKGTDTKLDAAEFWIRNMRMMNGICHEFGIAFFAILQPCMLVGEYQYTDVEYQAIEIKRGKREIELISQYYKELIKQIKLYDFIEDYTQIFSGMSDIYYDLCHWNDDGHEIIANQLQELIRGSL